MSDAWAVLVAAALGFVAICAALALVGRIIWWLLKPRLLDAFEHEFGRLLRETHHQVTVNHHSSAEPTVLDKLDDLNAEVRHHTRQIQSVENNVEALTTVLDAHLSTGDN